MPTNDTNMDDQRSFNLIRQGGKMREQGMFELHRKYAKELQKRISYNGHLNDDDAKDVVQETFIKIGLHCESYSGDALRQAQLDMITGKSTNAVSTKSYAHPYYWAPFVLMGNWL